MFAIFIICLFLSKSLAQIDGQFWWLNSKLDKFRAPPPQPKFEDISDFETDESVKIVFRDDDLLPREEKLAELEVDQVGKLNQAIKFEDKSEIAWPNYSKAAMAIADVPTKNNQADNESELNNSDIFAIKFPDDNFILRDKNVNKINKVKPVTAEDNNTMSYNTTGEITYLTNVVPSKDNKNGESENICTYMKKPDCSRVGGVVYVNHKSNWKQGSFDSRLICCILPLRPELHSSKIYFLDSPRPCKRCKRSEKEISTANKQRNALLLRKFGSQAHKLKITTPNPTILSHRVVTATDEYIDPYWNIKNIKNSNKPGNSFQLTKYDEEDYVEDYISEIPKPGLTGLYSDHGPTKPSWAFPTRPNYGVIDSDEVNDGFGYSPTVDPRLQDRRRATSLPVRVSGRPVKLSTYSNEKNYDAEATISYQSNPDFQVLQGFKLLNLGQNKNKVLRNGKKTTTERLFDSDSKEHVLTASLESFNNYGSADSEQAYSDCGKTAKGSHDNYEDGKETGETEKGSHPSLALVMLTKRRQFFLCYGTIIHPRAIITAADCVFGRTDPGEITVIAGTWRLDEETREEWQKRMATIHIHLQYRPGDLSNNLALLYWKRPLRLSANVQPACLSDPHVGDNCKFFGWGGFDQVIRKQSRWQRALVLAPRTCEERITNKRLPSDAFCASIQNRGSVTGSGGPLLCTIDGRQSLAGVVVWKDLAVVLQPAREWVTLALDDLQLD